MRFFSVQGRAFSIDMKGEVTCKTSTLHERHQESPSLPHSMGQKLSKSIMVLKYKTGVLLGRRWLFPEEGIIKKYFDNIMYPCVSFLYAHEALCFREKSWRTRKQARVMALYRNKKYLQGMKPPSRIAVIIFSTPKQAENLLSAEKCYWWSFQSWSYSHN